MRVLIDREYCIPEYLVSKVREKAAEKGMSENQVVVELISRNVDEL